MVRYSLASRNGDTHEAGPALRRIVRADRGAIPALSRHRHRREPGVLRQRTRLFPRRLDACVGGRGGGAVDRAGDDRARGDRCPLARDCATPVVAARRQGAGVSGCRHRAGAGPDREYRPEGSLGPSAAEPDHRIRRDPGVHAGAVIGRPMRAQLRLCFGSCGARLLACQLRAAAALRVAAQDRDCRRAGVRRAGRTRPDRGRQAFSVRCRLCRAHHLCDELGALSGNRRARSSREPLGAARLSRPWPSHGGAVRRPPRAMGRGRHADRDRGNRLDRPPARDLFPGA